MSAPFLTCPAAHPGRIQATPLSPATLDWYRGRGERWLRERAAVSWERPSRGLQVFGLGVAVRARGNRGEGFSAARRAAADLLCRLQVEDGTAPPLVFIGASFDPGAPHRDPAWDAFGGWQVLLPAITIIRDGDRWSGTACTGDFPGPGEAAAFPRVDSDRSTLARAISLAVGEIRAGQYEKVVLAASRLVSLDGVTPAEVLSRLADAFPTCCIFSIRSGGSTWLGASPEPLAAVVSGRVELVSLAGSRRRGSSPEIDRQLETELLSSSKERWEHRLVVDAILSDAGELAAGLEAQPEPSVMKLANIQHLYTPITGHLTPGATLLDLVERLHPTPAVGGWPRAEALDAIRRLERIDRGWYAGPIGWINPAGDGEFVVGLRTALLGRDAACLYAGAGIVADSAPAAELDEIETKLDALRGVIGQ